ncbi:MAG: MBL fold metallo-hydrolase [Deltaproteobacteria bacterium]|nr:MBL fold metallo-hydrolase [Deltaproteobacteria bacterium]
MVRVEKVDSRIDAITIDEKRTVWLIKGERNVLIDAGYPSDIDDLCLGLESVSMKPQDIHYLVLTHIHIDHAGGAGSIALKNPALKIFVHEKGASAIVNPEKLIFSVRRVYGKQYEEMGEILPLSCSDMVVPVKTGDRIDLGDSVLEVYYTPGHAKHHVVYFDRISESIFSGDALGSKYKNLPNFVLSPPSDYDRESAKKSIDLIESLKPKRINFAHCGSYYIGNKKNIYNELKKKHDVWTQCVIGIIKEIGNLNEDEIFKRFLEKVPGLKKYPDQYLSFHMSVRGILLYLKRKGIM